MKKIYLTLITLLFIISANAQYGIPKKRKSDADLIKSLPLLVVLHDYDSEFYQKMKVDLKEAMLKYWNYSENITFVSKDELREFAQDKSKKDKYAYFMYSEKLYQGNVPAGCFCIGLLNKKTFTHFKEFGNPGCDFSMADYKQGLYWLQKDLSTIINPKDLKANAGNLIKQFKEEVATGVLLLDKDLITEDLTESIEKVYKYEYKIVSKSKIDEAILNNTPNTLYLKSFYFLQRPIISTTRTVAVAGFSPNSSSTLSNRITTSSTGETVVETTRIRETKFTTNFIYKAEDGSQFAMFKTNPEGKTDFKQFKKGLKVLE